MDIFEIVCVYVRACVRACVRAWVSVVCVCGVYMCVCMSMCAFCKRAQSHLPYQMTLDMVD